MVVKTHGILMKGEMIRAYMRGLKTQTRRVRGLDEINQSPDDWGFHGFFNSVNRNREVRPKAIFRRKSTVETLLINLPYGGPGDTLWFKETHAVICREAVPTCECETEEEMNKNHYVEYRADTNNSYPGEWPDEEAKGNDEAPKWKPSMFMKHDYSRFKDIPILNVRVERLKDITEYDARAEGFPIELLDYPSIPPVTWYYCLWDKLNGDKMPVDRNPWVWVYEFAKYGQVVKGETIIIKSFPMQNSYPKE